MGDLLFYHNRKNKETFRSPETTQSLQLLHSMGNCQLLSSGKPSEIYFKKNELVEFYLIGNYTFYKDFHFNPDVLFQNNKINKNELNRLLRKINGTYCCILFNPVLNQVHFVTDFLGFYPAYLYQDDEFIIISSEIKYFKLIDNINLELDHEAIYSYLHNGHLILDQTWFKKIKRTRPASIYTLNLNDRSIKNEYYWTWADVRKRKLPKEEIIETYAKLFTNGIEELNVPADSRTAISLSGGLDSRWIAQIASKKFDLDTFTFSTGKNYETNLAVKVAHTLNIKHHNPNLEKSNWLMNRMQAFWKTDGMLHLGHLHEGNIHKQVYSEYTHCFHGFYGGGIYASTNECNHRITSKIAKAHFKFDNSDTKTEDPFYQTDSIDPYIVDQKIRYQSAFSIYLLSSYCKMIIPFYNMDWLEFNYSIDDKLQLNSKLYLEVLNSNLDDALLNIAWQKTGLTPKHIALNVASLKFKIPFILERASQFFNTSRHFINYNYFDAEIDFWILEFESDISNFQLNYSLNSREQKLRMLSLVVWLRMISKNSTDVL